MSDLFRTEDKKTALEREQDKTRAITRIMNSVDIVSALSLKLFESLSIHQLSEALARIKEIKLSVTNIENKIRKIQA